MKPHIVKRNGVWTCGLISVAEGDSREQAYWRWKSGAVVMYAHAGAGAKLTWREYVKTASA